MRLLLDNSLSPKLVAPLIEAGHDVAHVRDHQMAGADDASVLALAVESGRVVVSADSDFGTLLARTHAMAPSFLLVRRLVGRRVSELAAIIIDNLPAVEDDLDAGAVVVLGDTSLRLTPRRLVMSHGVASRWGTCGAAASPPPDLTSTTVILEALDGRMRSGG